MQALPWSTQVLVGWKETIFELQYLIQHNSVKEGF